MDQLTRRAAFAPYEASMLLKCISKELVKQRNNLSPRQKRSRDHVLAGNGGALRKLGLEPQGSVRRAARPGWPGKPGHGGNSK